MKEEYDKAQFFSHNTGSSHPSGAFRSHSYGIPHYIVSGLLAAGAVVFYLELTYKRDLESSSVFLQQLRAGNDEARRQKEMEEQAAAATKSSAGE